VLILAALALAQAQGQALLQPVLPPQSALPAQPALVPPLPTVPPATIDNQLEITGEALKAREVRNRLVVKTVINDQGPFDFFVDSGADRTVIGSALAGRLALPPGKEVTLHGTAGISRVGTVKIDSVKIGSSEVFGLSAPALAEENIGAQGLLGIDALADQRLMLDFEHKIIVVQDSRIPEKSSGNSEEIVVTARRRNGQLILTEASVERVNLYAIIDSGTEISVANGALRRRIIGTHRSSRTKTIELISVTGQSVVADLLIVPTLKLGGITFYNVPIAFADTPPFAVFGLEKQPAILLGTDVLQLFRRVSLDFRNRKVRFVLKS